jgi:predicted phosphate transport protein (TIGR00153 family)
MAFRLFPKEFSFNALFNEQVSRAVEVAKIFREVTEKGEVDIASLNKIRDLEHKADDAAHAIIDQLNATFITPFDREDIHALTLEIDDITDMINTIASRMKIYNITGVNKHLVEFAKVIEESVHAVASAVRGLSNTKNKKAILSACQEVNRLENVGDTMRDEFLEELFEKEKDPIAVIRLKDVYQYCETVLDICEDVANKVDSIMVKHA